MARGPTLSERIEQINERLKEVEDQQAATKPALDTDSNDHLIEEEHRLQTLLQKLTDQLIQEQEGIAEEIIKSEAANADEIPDLPPVGANEEPAGERSDQ